MNTKIRKPKGQMGPLFIILTIIIGLVIGALAVEFSHMHAVKTALQNTTDAAALAGAQDLWFELDKCEEHALAIAALNMVDGRAISPDTPGVTVDVIVTPPQGNTPGQVEVNASIVVRHIMSPFFEHWMDTVNAHSVAGTSGQLWMYTGNSFPLAVSLDYEAENKKGVKLPALNTLNPGDSVTFVLNPQNVKNATFTTLTIDPASASTLNSMIDQVLGNDPKKDVNIPSVTIGDEINLNNGIDGQKQLAKDPYYGQLLNAPFLVVPIVKGEPPFNQSATVVGFTAIKVTDVVLNSKDGMVEAITGTLMTPQVPGVSGPIPTTGIPVDDEAIARLDLGPIQLIR